MSKMPACAQQKALLSRKVQSTTSENLKQLTTSPGGERSTARTAVVGRHRAPTMRNQIHHLVVPDPPYKLMGLRVIVCARSHLLMVQPRTYIGQNLSEKNLVLKCKQMNSSQKRLKKMKQRKMSNITCNRTDIRNIKIHNSRGISARFWKCLDVEQPCRLYL